MLTRLFIAALWSPAGNGLSSWLLFVMFTCVFVTFPCVILGQVWYLIVSIPDLCRLSYFCILPGREDKAIILTFKAPVTTNAVLKPRKNSVDKDKTALFLVHAVRFFSNIWQFICNGRQMKTIFRCISCQCYKS